MMIDSHCHLDTAVWGDDAGVDAVIARARAAGVDRMVTIGSGYGFESADRAVVVARRHPDCVRAAVGLHPHDAKLLTDDALAALLALADAPEVVALGEMGLDFHYDSSPREVQREAFRAQLRAARARGLPVIIHDRESGGETLAILDEERAWDTGVLFHCYTGDVAYMEAIVARGGSVSIPGIVTFKNGDTMREVAARVPLERLLIETDSPFLTPIPHRGTRNEPAYVALVAAKVAEVRGMDPGALAEACARNTLRFFRWTHG
jgi:TatD DNase family protein